MSDTAERPATDADAWATACAEDLAAEKARRRDAGTPPPGSAAEELRKLLDAVGDRLGDLQGLAAPLLGPVARGMAQQMAEQAVRQARAVVEPVVERHPDVFDHLAAAGSELLAAYRSAVTAQEQRWTAGGRPGIRDVRTGTETAPDAPGTGGTPRHQASGEQDGGEGDPGPGEHIDLD